MNKEEVEKKKDREKKVEEEERMKKKREQLKWGGLFSSDFRIHKEEVCLGLFENLSDGLLTDSLEALRGKKVKTGWQNCRGIATWKQGGREE